MQHTSPSLFLFVTVIRITPFLLLFICLSLQAATAASFVAQELKPTKLQVACRRSLLLYAAAFSPRDKSLPNYLRILTSTTKVEEGKGKEPRQQTKIKLQTCVRTFERKNVQIDLHAQVHFADDKYFRYYNNYTGDFEAYDRIHYELITSENLLSKDSNGRRKIPQRYLLMPSLADQQTALRYNLSCQVNEIDYSQPNWYCSDYTREEYNKLLVQDAASFTNNQQIPTTKNNFLGGELFQALLRPSTPAQDGLTTRLYSNLFLSGEGLTFILRSLLWITVPVPELSILILDWSSLSPRAGGVSPVSVKVLESLIAGNLKIAQKLIFTQMLVSGQANVGSSSLIIGKRNEYAMQVLKKSIENDGCTRVALIYGALHCKDLQRRLEESGFKCTNTKWRTAWKIITTSTQQQPTSFLGTIAVIFLLLVSGLDWLSTLHEVGNSFEIHDVGSAAAAALLYLTRHVAIYFGLAKFVIEWDTGLFEATERPAS